ncbi:MAG TPA: hypothetical protein VFA90_06185 [Terriglobales bacterium]|jgi:hypothetical protein|nr:hypothetical protein [Terriglobales bacterium]
MKRARLIRKLPFLLLLFSPLLCGADLSTYRGFQFGMSLDAAAKHSGMDMSEVTTIHERPARIQELTWNPGRFSGTSGDTDPVEQVVFSFYNGQLFRIVVNYDDQKTQGLSADDLTEAFSTRYGAATHPPPETRFPSTVFSAGVTVVACWADAEYSFNLAQSPYGSSFELIAFSKHLNALAHVAIATGIQMDAQEAPERQKAEEQNAQSKSDKARLVNKGHFRP